jgi:hypothetical protein
MKRKERPVRGEVLFAGMVSATVPYEAQFRFAVYSQEGGGCRVVYERQRVYSAFPTTRDSCEAALEAFTSVTQSLDAARDECGEH